MLRSQCIKTGLAAARVRHQPSVAGREPALRGMNVWRAGRIAIDANYVSSWDGLGIVRCGTRHCSHPFAHISGICMVPARAGTDGKRFPDQALDHRSRGIGSGTTGLIVKAWNPAVLIGPPSSLPEFPPVIEVCSPSLMPVWEIRMLRASAALRLIHAWFRGVAHRSR